MPDVHSNKGDPMNMNFDFGLLTFFIAVTALILAVLELTGNA